MTGAETLSADGPACRVALHGDGRRWALIREPAGFDEQSVGGCTTLDAVRLLDRLLIDHPLSAVRPGASATLTVVDRDLLLAAAYGLGWGRRITGVVTCAGCGCPFDLDFDLDDLADHVRIAASAEVDDDGVCTLPTGARFRLPTAQDEAAVLGLPDTDAERGLLERCLLSGGPTTDRPLIERAMERVGSGVDVDLAATCPECGHGATARFGIQDYLLSAVRTDWAGLVEDLHRMAFAYHWGLREMLALPRSSRRAFVALLGGDPVAGTAERR